MKRVKSIYIVFSLLALVTVLVLVNAAENPHGDIRWDCTDCHTTESWHTLRDSLTFNHDETGFRLDAAHKSASCGRCHTDPIFSHVGTACADCHADHHGGQLGDDCSECHTPLDWQPRMDILNKHAERGFPLTGVHAVADCESCHAEGERDQLVGTATECQVCHMSQALQVKSPDHSQPGFESDCERCHHAAFGDWRQTTYNHEFFPLTGAHKNLQCIQCHENGYSGTPTDCFGCHESNYNATTDPNHVASQFSTDCASCHNNTAWQPATFDHNATGFPLTGQHVSVNCIACHESTYAGTPANCYACHRTDYEGTTDPAHGTLGFPTTCEDCHTTSGWQPASFDHNATSFPLTGQHVSLNCLACHQTTYAGTPTNCYACHQTDYEGTTDPNHSAAGFQTTCEDCHTTDSWTSASFDHSTTGFALTGQHTTLNCVACHQTTYAGTSTDCYACHQSDYEGTTDPNHSTLGFSTTCDDCHTTNNWESASFDHNTTGFVLTGQHTALNCVACHQTTYAGTSTDCYACHQSDYEGTTDPNHGTLGFPTTCDDCHTTDNWTSASFDHNSTAFPLTGQHVTLNCIACHQTTYAGTPTSCYACHQTDYEGTTDPTHSAAGFPTNCESCHTTDGWSPSTWDHDAQYFPIYSGAHLGRWTECIECHTLPSDFSTFDCTACHAHNQIDMDSHHSGVRDYVYDSNRCYECHPRGNS